MIPLLLNLLPIQCLPFLLFSQDLLFSRRAKSTCITMFQTLCSVKPSCVASFQFSHCIKPSYVILSRCSVMSSCPAVSLPVSRSFVCQAPLSSPAVSAPVHRPGASSPVCQALSSNPVVFRPAVSAPTVSAPFVHRPAVSSPVFSPVAFPVVSRPIVYHIWIAVPVLLCFFPLVLARGQDCLVFVVFAFGWDCVCLCMVVCLYVFVICLIFSMFLGRVRFPGKVGELMLPVFEWTIQWPCTPATWMDKLAGQQALYFPSRSLAVHLKHKKTYSMREVL